MVVADIDFPCGRYGFFAVADIVLLWPIWLWPIWFVADMVAPQNVRLPTVESSTGAGGTIKLLVSAERTVRRPGTSEHE